MKISIIGSEGIVGSALKFGFRKLNHDVISVDLKLPETSIKNVLDTDICFICVPTPKNLDGSCNTYIVEDVIEQLNQIDYDGIKVIKSTVTPGTTDKLLKQYNYKLPNIRHSKICHSCEFLRERQNIGDFIENQKLLVVGTDYTQIYEKVCEAHGNYPQKTVMMTPTESETLKYFHNCINILRIVFANEFYDICQKLNVDYTRIKNALLHSTSLPDQYLDVNKNMLGYSSICFSKDLPAIVKLAKDFQLDLPVLYNLETSNSKRPLTPFAGTRP